MTLCRSTAWHRLLCVQGQTMLPGWHPGLFGVPQNKTPSPPQRCPRDSPLVSLDTTQAEGPTQPPPPSPTLLLQFLRVHCSLVPTAWPPQPALAGHLVTHKAPVSLSSLQTEVQAAASYLANFSLSHGSRWPCGCVLATGGRLKLLGRASRKGD